MTHAKQCRDGWAGACLAAGNGLHFLGRQQGVQHRAQGRLLKWDAREALVDNGWEVPILVGRPLATCPLLAEVADYITRMQHIAPSACSTKYKEKLLCFTSRRVPDVDSNVWVGGAAVLTVTGKHFNLHSSPQHSRSSSIRPRQLPSMAMICTKHGQKNFILPYASAYEIAKAGMHPRSPALPAACVSAPACLRRTSRKGSASPVRTCTPEQASREGVGCRCTSL